MRARTRATSRSCVWTRKAHSCWHTVERHCPCRRAARCARTTKPDFVRFTCHLLKHVYRSARRVHLVLDNLNTHFRSSFDEVLGVRAARRLLRRVEFHYTPKHASWLNMAEIEIGVLTRQCLDRRMPDLISVTREVRAWQQRRNRARCTIEWSFTRQDADRKLSRNYVS